MVLSHSSDDVPLKLNNGALLIGNFANLMLYTLELLQAYHYFTNRWRTRNDSLLIKMAVALCLLADTAGTAGGCAFVFLNTVNYWGDAEKVRHGSWPLVLILASSIVCQLVVQCFMVYRFFRISHKYIRYIVSLFILLLVTGGVWGMLRSTIRGAKYEDFSYRFNEVRYVTIGLSCTAGADIAITISLLWQLHRFAAYSKYMKELLRRISILAIITGIPPSLTAIACLIAFLLRPESQVCIAVFLLLGRMYTSTMLFTLNNREKLREISGPDSVHINVSSFQAGCPTRDTEEAGEEMHEISDMSGPVTPRSNTLLPLSSSPTSLSFPLQGATKFEKFSRSASSDGLGQQGIQLPSPALMRYSSLIV
ncbi:hypothetical protein NP233_g1103 [Leucocoprinus birnbaumii]|uniref:DUF6534 domain-containing protein n=1 Tax=Leucocoprinus birnbaumii TaxID=56174 RepID=A0AAD5YZV7_9AGAR|nr:hypothetical protein NP233_g1103 [Leucocoprinus birnbaumii]